MSIFSKILDGMYSNFIPTVVGVFIALWIANYTKDIEEKRLFRKMIDNSVLELHNIISRNNSYLNLLDTLKLSDEASTSFARINLQYKPANLDLLVSNTINKFVEPSLISQFYGTKQNIELFSQQFKYENFNKSTLIKSLETYNEIIGNTTWLLYQISQNRNIELTDTKRQEFIRILNKSIENKVELDLYKLKL
ncbi:MAG: hypothetical protein JHC39_08855 [Lentimicrobium sp.]|jgi:hypothetical protein|nr:hypothetical protein [Lentimicrobium sp.]